VYFKHLLTAAAARPPDADFNDLLPDVWRPHAPQPRRTPNATAGIRQFAPPISAPGAPARRGADTSVDCTLTEQRQTDLGRGGEQPL